MNKKTLLQTALLVVGIGGVMLYLQTNEADDIEHTVIKVESEKAPKLSPLYFDVAAYEMYYADAAFYSKEEAQFHSLLDVISRQTILLYMYEAEQYLSQEELAIYKQQARDEYAYERKKDTKRAYYDRLLEDLHMSEEQYIDYVYKKRISDILYSKFSSAMITTEANYERSWYDELEKHDLDEETIVATLDRFDKASTPVSPQPDWLMQDENRPMLLKEEQTGRIHLSDDVLYDMRAYAEYMPIIQHIEQALQTTITRSSIEAAIDILNSYKPTAQQQRAYEEIVEIFGMLQADREPF